MKVVINACFGGFSISKEAAELMAELGHQGATEALSEYKNRDMDDSYERIYSDRGLTRPFYGRFDMNRHDAQLVAAVEALGENADGFCASLKVVEIPDDVQYVIEEYDGNEHVAEVHRTWS